MPSRDDHIDEDYTVADMSMLNGTLPPSSSRDVREELGDRESQLMVVLGTLRAALSIGLVYIVAFGVFIAILLLLWR